MKATNIFLIIIVLIFGGVYYYLFVYKRITCKLCGAFGYSDNIEESIDRKTFVRLYNNFEVQPDSLSYIKVNNKIFYVEKKFRYGKKNTLETIITPDSAGFKYQFRISPRSGDHLKSKHHLFCTSNFFVIPDTINCEIWSYSVNGENIEKIGDAIIY